MADGTISDASHACKTCGEPFERRKGQNLHCSPACRRAYEQANRQSCRHANGVRPIGSLIQCGRCGQCMQFRGRRHFYCEPCSLVRRKEKSAEWRVRNPEKRREIEKAHAKKRGKDPKRRAWWLRYQPILSARRNANPKKRLDHRVSQMVRSSLSTGKQGKSWPLLLGYSLDALYSHLEKQFMPGMSWHNMGEWHIDHVIPRSSFAYKDANDPEFFACWSLTNLRPLWAEQNISKGGKRTLLL